MKVIAFQYYQLLLSASDAGRSKIRLRSNIPECDSVRPLPVTTASQALILYKDIVAWAMCLIYIRIRP